jgi:hypothetical protein
MNAKLGRIWHSPGKTEENNKNPHIQIAGYMIGYPSNTSLEDNTASIYG